MPPARVITCQQLICCITFLLVLLHVAVDFVSKWNTSCILSKEKVVTRKPCKLQPCCDVRRPLPASVRTNGPWQIQDTGYDKLVLYSAFYDDRPAVGATPWIRVQGVAKLAHWTHYCHVWISGHDEPYVTTLIIRVIGRLSGYVIRNTTYVQYLFGCKLPGTESVPSHVSIVADRCAQSTIYLPVERPVRAEPDIEFGVCVAISFGNFPTPALVEWMELTWMLGVREFNIYDAGMVNMSDVFNYYTRRGWLKVHPMPPPVPDETVLHSSLNRNIDQKRLEAEIDAVKLATQASLNDCMMRNAYRYRYVVVIDFDEFIIPLSHDNYSHLIQHINTKYPPQDQPREYTFQNTYFFRNLTPDLQKPAYLRSARFRRSAPPSGQTAPKSIVDPRTCLVAFNHYCLQSLLPPHSSRRRFSVRPYLARSHHYRLCPFKLQDCLRLFNQTTVDDIMLKFKPRLQPAVEEVMEKLNVSM